MRTKAVSLLQELTEAHSVSGHEDEVRAIFVDELGDCGELSADRNGSVFCETGDDGPSVMVAGHMDEVGFMVQNITGDGYLQFVAIGGWWEHNLLSQRVEILTRGGDKVLGVIASRPPHFLPEAQRRQVMSIDQMFIDVGAESRRDVVENFGISLGDPIAPVSIFTAMTREDPRPVNLEAGRVGRPHGGQGDAPERVPARGAEGAGRVLDTRVELTQRRLDRDHEEGHRDECLGQDDTGGGERGGRRAGIGRPRPRHPDRP